ncbi:solute carrier family 35 member C2 [Parasteatoda tepidariorum]|uniref:solute carrier family 35 member C2 n=1 Tax=Parasteatoda tepidariorum TaxID=114398 RepID=UPI0039BD87FB
MKRRREVPQSGSPNHQPATFQSYLQHLNVCCFPCTEEYNPKMKRFDSFCTVRLILMCIRTLGLVSLYYCFSIGITFYQKWFIKDFHFPLTVVICHLVVKFILSGMLRCLYHIITGRQRVVLDWPTYIKQLAPTGVASALDIGLSNWSFEFITVSLYTMTKSTCIIFILGFSILFGLEKKRYSLIIVIALIAAGLFMFTYQSTQFNLDGFLLVLTASFLAGLRWTLAQMVVQKKELGLSNPVDMIYHVQPWMVIGLLPLAIVFEGIPIATTEKVFRYKEVSMVMTTVGYILLGSFLAFLMELSEYLLLLFTSSLTLSIAGVFKEVCTLYLAVKYTGDHMSTLNFIGLLVCLIGITLHVVLKALHSDGKENSPMGNLIVSCYLKLSSIFLSFWTLRYSSLSFLFFLCQGCQLFFLLLSMYMKGLR